MLNEGTISHKNMTTGEAYSDIEHCPAEEILKLLAGKWKPQILRLASQTPVRFNNLLKLLPGASKQSISVALKELEEGGILTKSIIRKKPLHIEYTLSEKGKLTLPVFVSLSEVQRKHG
jgi:DNA-binding HxlR family transcriptional regulator